VDRDLVAALVMLGLAALYYAGAAGLPTTMITDPVGAAGLPKSLAVVLGLLSLLLAAKTLVRRRARRAPAPSDDAEAARGHRYAIGMLAIGAGYVLAAETVGYVPAIAAAILAAALYQGAGRTWRLPLVAGCGALGLWLLFVRVLDIDQPEGVWPALLGWR
jgi:hypothetical protein